MSRTLLRVFALAAALLAAQGSAQAQNPKEPNVVVTNGTVTVDPDPIRLRRGHVENGRWRIMWVLARSGDFRFTEDGISVHPASENGALPDDLLCVRLSNGARFFCSFKPRNGNFNYKYDVNVVNQTGGRISLDPIINTEF